MSKVFKFLNRAIANVDNNHVYISVPYKFGDDIVNEYMSDVINSCLHTLCAWLKQLGISITNIRFEAGPCPWMEFYVGDEAYCAECLSDRWQVILPLPLPIHNPSPTYEQLKVLL